MILFFNEREWVKISCESKLSTSEMVHLLIGYFLSSKHTSPEKAFQILKKVLL